MHTHLGDSLFPATHSLRNNGFLIKGKIVEESSRNGLSYVNIGIPNKNSGTVSSRDGSFEIRSGFPRTDRLPDDFMVGYKSRLFAISELLKQPKPTTITAPANTNRPAGSRSISKETGNPDIGKQHNFNIRKCRAALKIFGI